MISGRGSWGGGKIHAVIPTACGLGGWSHDWRTVVGREVLS